jgi:hypothetical protein
MSSNGMHRAGAHSTEWNRDRVPWGDSEKLDRTGRAHKKNDCEPVTPDCRRARQGRMRNAAHPLNCPSSAPGSITQATP